MKGSGKLIDRAAGRVYTRILAVVAAVISVVMLVSAVVSWWLSGVVGGLVWLAGAALFGLIARASWRSKAGLGDIDFTA